MNVKLTEFNGIYLNADENSIKTGFFKESLNFSHEDGYVTFDPHTFTSIDRCIQLPEGFSWEKGVIASLSSDNLSESIEQKTYEILVLSAVRKVPEGSGIIAYRRLYMAEGNWGEFFGLFKEDTNPLANLCISESDFTTQIQGDVHFLNTDGVLKIYLPHMSFWLGRLERKIYRVPDWTYSNPIGGFYFDRLIEPYTGDFSVDLSGGVSFPVCSEKRRLGFSASISVSADASVVTGDTNVNLSFQGMVTISPMENYSGFDMTGYGFYLTDALTGEFITPLVQYNASDTKMHVFWKEMNSGEAMLIPDEYNSKLKYSLGDMLLTDTYGPFVYEPHTSPNDLKENGQSFIRAGFQSFIDNAAAHGLKWLGKTVELTGFSNTIKKLDVIVTAELDRQSEIIIYKMAVDTNTEAQRFALKFSDVIVPQDSNARLTGFNIFIKALDYLDYKLCKTVDLLNPKEKDFRTFYIDEKSVGGVTLTQKTGYYFDEMTEKYYSPLTGLRDVTAERGTSVALSSISASSAYYSAVGSGRAMPDVFYRSSIIERHGLNSLSAAASCNGRFILFGSSKSVVVQITGDGVIDIIDSLETGCKGKRDIAEAGDKLFINTEKGIYALNGFEQQKLSGAVDNVVRDNYKASFIKYNPVRQELILFASSDSKPYRLKLDKNKWDQLYLQDTEAISIKALDMFFDGNGQEIIISGSVYRRSGYNAVPEGVLVTNAADFGEASLDKFVDRLLLDMKGAALVSLNMDTRKVRYLFTSEERKTVTLTIPPDKRYPFRKLSLMFKTAGEGFSLYKAEMEISAIKRRTLNETEIKAVG